MHDGFVVSSNSYYYFVDLPRGYMHINNLPTRKLFDGVMNIVGPTYFRRNLLNYFTCQNTGRFGFFLPAPATNLTVACLSLTPMHRRHLRQSLLLHCALRPNSVFPISKRSLDFGKTRTKKCFLFFLKLYPVNYC